MFTIREISALEPLIIDGELRTQSDRDVIVCDLANMNETVGVIGTSQKITGWSVKALSDEKKREICIK